MGFAYDLLAPGNITRVMQESQDKLILPMPLKWYERAAKVNASDDEMTLKEKSYVYAADIISADSRALIRDAGEFKFERHGINKLKHGFALSESMIKTIRRIEANRFLEGDVISFQGMVARRQKELQLGIQQRVESMINGMLCDDYEYRRFGIEVEGSWGMPDDLKFTPTNDWEDAANATPLQDMITVLHYGQRHWGEMYNRITLTYAALANIVATTEFKDTYKAEKYNWNVGNASIDAGNVNPMNRLGFLSAYISSQVEWEVVVETDEGHFREFSPSTLKAPGRFHPDNKVYFTSTNDDGTSAGWDVANGETVEALLGQIHAGNIIGGNFNGVSAFGPIGYTTLADPNLNPPGMVIWAAAWQAPRRHRDTCSALLTAW